MKLHFFLILVQHFIIGKWAFKDFAFKGFNVFQKSLRPCAFDQNSLSIGRVKQIAGVIVVPCLSRLGAP